MRSTKRLPTSESVPKHFMPQITARLKHRSTRLFVGGHDMRARGVEIDRFLYRVGPVSARAAGSQPTTSSPGKEIRGFETVIVSPFDWDCPSQPQSHRPLPRNPEIGRHNCRNGMELGARHTGFCVFIAVAVADRNVGAGDSDDI